MNSLHLLNSRFGPIKGFSLTVWAALASLLSLGCGVTEKEYPVSGKVIVGDQPASGLYVVFHPVSNSSESRSPYSVRTDKSGSYSIRLKEPGEFSITVFWPMVITDEGETIEGDDAFAGRYRDPKRSLTRVAIREGDNALPTIKIPALD